jgi:hypothetical protein
MFAEWAGPRACPFTLIGSGGDGIPSDPTPALTMLVKGYNLDCERSADNPIAIEFDWVGLSSEVWNEVQRWLRDGMRAVV